MKRLLPLLGCALLMPFAGAAQSLIKEAQQAPVQQLVDANDFAQYQAQTRRTMTDGSKTHRTSSRPVSSGARRAVDPCNLLPNPSFEEQNRTPSGRRFNVFSPNPNTSDELSGWMSTNGSTPDYFATNAPSPSDTNPRNQPSTGLGTFMPHDYDQNLRNGTVGLLINPSGNDQEYITPRNGAISLSQGAYYAAFYGYCTTSNSNTTKLGLDLIPSTSGDPRTAIKSAAYPKTSNSIESPGLITGASWTEVSGVLTNVAAGNYYVNIGNISPTTQSATGQAYYYIDDVQLYKIPTAGNNITYVCGRSVTIGEGCSIPDAQYAWTTPTNSTPFATTLQTLVTPSPGSQPQYILTVTLPNQQHSTYSTTVTVTPALPSAGQNQTICPGESVTLGEGCNIPGAQYQWSTPTRDYSYSSQLTFTVNPAPAGTYYLTVALPNGTSYVSTVTVTIGNAPPNAPDINLAAWGWGQPSPGSAYEYDVRVNNVSPATSFTLSIETQDGSGNWVPSGISTRYANVYTGFDNASSNEAQGFTTFHTRIPGPTPPVSGSSGPGNTYRFTVTVDGACRSVVAQKIITLPSRQGEGGGGGEESSRSASNNSASAYPNPASESITIPGSFKDATLINAKGKVSRKADASGHLDVQDLPDGLYNLQMMRNGKLINQRIQVKH